MRLLKEVVIIQNKMSRKSIRLENIQEANRRVLSEQVIHNMGEALRIARENGSVVVSAEVAQNEMRDYREPNGAYIISDGENEGVYRIEQSHYGPDGEYGDHIITHVPDEVFRREMNDKISMYQDMINRLDRK